MVELQRAQVRTYSVIDERIEDEHGEAIASGDRWYLWFVLS